MGIIDIEPYGESIFSQVRDSAKLLVRFGVGYDQVDLKAASANGILWPTVYLPSPDNRLNAHMYPAPPHTERLSPT